MNNNEVNVIAEAMLEKKAKNVVSLDLSTIGTAISDYFIVCNADSTTAVAAIADNILNKMQERCGKKVIRMQGLENNFWIILDYGHIVVHVFLTEYRDFYKLEDLWADAVRTEHDYAPEFQNEVQAGIKTKAASKIRKSVRKNNKGE